MKHKFLDGFALGLAIGFMLSFLIIWVMDGSSNVIQTYLSEHITHIVTVLAAALALFGISKQIQSNFELMEKTRLAKLDAAKATLPIVLSNIVGLCEERYYSIAFGQSTPEPSMQWEITDFELATLKECIEHSEGFEKVLLLQIGRVYQVLVSRWNTLEHNQIFGAPDTPTNTLAFANRLEQFHAIEGWAALRSIAMSLFDYSRGARSNPSFDSMITSTLFTLSHLHAGGLTGEGGAALRNNGDYDRFVQRKLESRQISFLDEDWE